MCELSDELATYLCKMLESSSMMGDLQTFFCNLTASEHIAQLTEFLYEAIETTCGIKTSIQGYLSSSFVLNCMNLASVKSLGGSREVMA